MTSSHPHPRPSSASLQRAELARLDHDIVVLEEAKAGADPVLATFLAATRACRAEVARSMRSRATAPQP